jgi:hypothetical protein
MYELGRLLVDRELNTTLGQSMLAEAAEFKADIIRAADASAVKDKLGKVFFLPPVVGANQTAFQSMTANGMASYSNFRYFSETLSAGCLGAKYDTALMEFRETHGGTLMGMTRFRGWLDDMPTVGYAKSDIQYDRIPVFLQLLAGHIGGYQSPGTFWSTEQMALVGEGRWRGLLGGIVDIDYCVPSSMLPAFMAKWQMVYEDTDAGVVYVGRAAPRRWWQVGAEAFGATLAPTRYGVLSFEVSPPTAADCTTATVNLAIIKATGRVTLAVRVRSPTTEQAIATVVIKGGSGAVVISTDAAKELVVVKLGPGQAVLTVAFAPAARGA